MNLPTGWYLDENGNLCSGVRTPVYEQNGIPMNLPVNEAQRAQIWHNLNNEIARVEQTMQPRYALLGQAGRDLAVNLAADIRDSRMAMLKQDWTKMMSMYQRLQGYM